MYTGHRRTFAKVSNDILIGLTNRVEIKVTNCLKISVLLNKFIYEKRL